MVSPDGLASFLKSPIAAHWKRKSVLIFSSLALFNIGSNSERVWGGRGFVGRQIRCFLRFWGILNFGNNSERVWVGVCRPAISVLFAVFGYCQIFSGFYAFPVFWLVGLQRWQINCFLCFFSILPCWFLVLIVSAWKRWMSGPKYLMLFKFFQYSVHVSKISSKLILLIESIMLLHKNKILKLMKKSWS